MTLSDAAQVAKEEYLAGKIDLRQLMAMQEGGDISNSEYEEIRTYQKNLDTPISLEEQEALMGSTHHHHEDDPPVDATGIAALFAFAQDMQAPEEPEDELDLSEFIEKTGAEGMAVFAAGSASAGVIIDLKQKRAEKKQLEAKKPVTKPKAKPRVVSASKLPLPPEDAKVFNDAIEAHENKVAVARENTLEGQEALAKVIAEKKATPKRKTLAEKKADLAKAVEQAAEPKAKKAKQVEGPDNGNGRKRGVRWAVKECVLANPTMKPVDILVEISKNGVQSKEGSVASIRQDFLMTLRAAKNLNKLKKTLTASVTDMKGNRKSSTALLIYNELILKNPQVTEKELYEEMKKLGHQVAGQGSYSAIRESLAVLREGKALS